MSAHSTAAVVVVGSVNMDMVAHAGRLPQPGETVMGERFAATPGGKGANQAVAAARLGAPTALIARVGTQLHGAELLAGLRAEGVLTQACVADENAMPGIAVIMVASQDGENAIVVIPGSNADLTAADVRAQQSLLQDARVVVAQLEVPQAAIAEAFSLARSAGVSTVLNAAPALALQEGLLAQTDCLIVNEGEAALLSGEENPERAAAELLRRGPRQIIVTLGARGALLLEATGSSHIAATRVMAVDTVGAGDTFVGGFATGLSEGMTAQAAVRFGQAAAAIAVSRAGVQSAMPIRAEMDCQPGSAPAQK